MKLFIDSADLDEIRQFYAWGIADGVTTNPSLIKKAVEARSKKGHFLDLKSYIIQILKTARGTPVSLEVTETSAEGMIAQGKALYELFNPPAKNVCIKIPINPVITDTDKGESDGLLAIKVLAKYKIPVNCTLVFTPEQALLAAKAGATFVSPFAGRVDDLLRKKAGIRLDKEAYFPLSGINKNGKLLDDQGICSGIDLVAKCVDVIKKYKLPTKVLAASLRTPRQVREAALVGADVATVPFSVLRALLRHPKTQEGMVLFTKDIVAEYVALTAKQTSKKIFSSDRLGVHVEWSKHS